MLPKVCVIVTAEIWTQVEQWGASTLHHASKNEGEFCWVGALTGIGQAFVEGIDGSRDGVEIRHNLATENFPVMLAPLLILSGDLDVEVAAVPVSTDSTWAIL